jgi:hypothetical protein
MWRALKPVVIDRDEFRREFRKRFRRMLLGSTTLKGMTFTGMYE